MKREKFHMTIEIRKDSTNVYAIGVDWSYLRISGNSHGLTTWIKPFCAFFHVLTGRDFALPELSFRQIGFALNYLRSAYGLLCVLVLLGERFPRPGL